MSDHYICFLPADASFIPSRVAQGAGVALLRAAWPEAREITSETEDHIVFRDCGENFESVRCPHCSAPLDIDQSKLHEGDPRSRAASRAIRGLFRDGVSMPDTGHYVKIRS
jgi:hypothetical protein